MIITTTYTIQTNILSITIPFITLTIVNINIVIVITIIIKIISGIVLGNFKENEKE